MFNMHALDVFDHSLYSHIITHEFDNDANRLQILCQPVRIKWGYLSFEMHI